MRSRNATNASQSARQDVDKHALKLNWAPVNNNNNNNNLELHLRAGIKNNNNN